LLPIINGLKGKIGVIWDILHPIRFSEPFEVTAHNLKPYIKHVHIKDSKVFNEEYFDFELPGNGSMPIPRLIENLKSISYEEYLSFEWEKGWHPEIFHCDIAFPHYISYIKKYL
jgi:sugar phosphate isomerase/epimerase